MAFNYTSKAKLADNKLAYFGQPVTITNKVTGVYDPNTGTSSQTISTQNGIGVIRDRGSKEIDGTIIEMGDKMLLLSAVDITKPQINDTVLVGSISYTIKEPLIEINPAGTVVMYKLNLRV